MNKLDLPVKIDKYILQEEIGGGTYGTVYRAQHVENYQYFAVKQVSINSIQSHKKLQMLFEDEVDITSTINHKNIIHLFHLLKTETDYLLVYEYCEQGTSLTLRRHEKLH